MSKKHIAKLVAIIMLIALFCVTLVGCDGIFIKENPERVSNQTLVTINKDGIELTVTQYELLEYYSTYAYYLMNYYKYDIDEAFDWALENKIKSKYLTIEGMTYLSNTANRAERNSSLLMGKGKVSSPVDVLTPAEYYAAVLSVNNSIDSAIETYMDEYYQGELKDIVKGLQNTDVHSIEFFAGYEAEDGTIVNGTVAGTDSKEEEIKGYLQDEYYLNQGIDTDRIMFRVVYEKADGTHYYSEPAIVPKTMYKTEFDSSEEGADKEIVISFEEKVTDKDGNVTFEDHTASFGYDVVTPRATKTVEEDVDVDEITLADDIKVNRYATDKEIKAKGASVELIDLKAVYNALKADLSADPAEVDAYRQLTEAMASNHTSIEASYKSAYESAVVTALSVEVKKGTEEITVSDKEIYDEFMYLYNTDKNKYSDTDKDANTEAFGSAIKSGLDTAYYIPPTETLNLGKADLSDYFYVMQILFNFSEEDKAFAEANISKNEKDKDHNNAIYDIIKEHTTTKASNPDYDADYDCPCHEAGGADDECIYDGDGVCPSQAYVGEDVKVTEVMAELETALKNATTGEEKYKIFEEYMYKYNDDPGTMNSSGGYLIAPKDDAIADPNGFYEEFNNLAWEVAGDTPTVGDAFVTDASGNETLGYAYTPYGIHLICVSMTPFGDNYQSQDYSTMDMATVIELLKKQINLKGDTLYDVIKDTLKTEKETARYTDYNNATVPAEIDKDTKFVTVEEKKVESLKEEYTTQK